MVTALDGHMGMATRTGEHKATMNVCQALYHIIFWLKLCTFRRVLGAQTSCLFVPLTTGAQFPQENFTLIGLTTLACNNEQMLHCELLHMFYSEIKRLLLQ